MNKSSEETSYFENGSFIIFLIKWRKPLLFTGILSAVFSILVSFLIVPKFKSSVILFPAATNSISSALLGEEQGKTYDLLEFGQEEEAEQILQILNSDEIRNSVVKKFNLMQHYGIESSDPYKNTKLLDEYESNITFERTEFMSVRIEVLDPEPQMAADIANFISSMLDTVKTKIQRERAVEALAIIEKEYRAKLDEVRIKEDSLRNLRLLGIFDYTTQSEELNKEFIQYHSLYKSESAKLPIYKKYYDDKDSTVVNTMARIRGAEAGVTSLQSQLKQMAQLGGSYFSINEMLWQERSQLAFLKKRFEKARVDVMQTLTQKFTVNKAVKSEKKSYPIRWLIVVFSVISSLLLCIIVITFIENVRYYRDKVQSE